MPEALPTLIIKMPQIDSEKSEAKQQAYRRQMNHSHSTPKQRNVLADCVRTRQSPMGAPRSVKRWPQSQTNFSPLKRLLRPTRGPLNKSLLLLLVLVAALACGATAKPNNNQNKNQQNQIHLTDKQLIRKAHDSSESLSRDNGSGSNRATGNNNSNSNGPANQEQSASSSSVFSCPEQFGYYTDTKDCTKYYVCVFGEVLHESCTGGLRFSRELQTCDWPRNVECPAGQPAAAASSSDGTGSPTAPAAPSTSATGSTQASTMSSFSSTSPSSTTPASITTTTVASSTTSQQSNQVDSAGRMKGAPNSMAFADEASDPQQPSFDEAISPVITADGVIHLHDGSGGTFGLAPNHNRALQSPQSLNGPLEGDGLSGGGSSSGRNMDVFVMPLTISNQAGRGQQQQGSALRPSASTNKRQQQQQQFSATANSGQNQARHHQLMSNLNQNQPNLELNGDAGNQNGANPNKVLMPATLPPRARQQQSQFDNGNSGNDLNSRQAPSDNREENRNNFREAELSDESGDFNLASPNQDGAANLDSDGNPNDGLLAPQADQDSLNNGNENDGSSSNSDQLGLNNGGGADDENNGNTGERPLASMPPVNTGATFSPTNLQNNQNRPPNRQQQASSPLLSINNRQIVDPTRQTFKPIIAPSQAQLQNGQLISSSSRPPPSEQKQQPPLRPQQPNINLNANNVNLNTNRQMSLQQQQNNRQSRMSSAFNSQAQNLAQAPRQQARQRPALLTNTFQATSNQSARFFPFQNSQQVVASNVNSFASEPQQQPARQSRLQESSASRGTQNLPQATFQTRFPSATSSNLQQQTNQQTSSLQRSQNPLFPTPRPINTFTGQPGAGQPFGDSPPSSATNFSSSLPLDQFSASADQFIRNNEPALQSVAPRRPRPPKRNQIPNQSRRQPNALLDFDPTTTTTSTTTMSTPIQRLQTASNGFSTGPSSQDFNDDQGPPSSTPESFPQDQAGGVFEMAPPPGTRQQQQQQPLRPLVATNSLNFRDSSATLSTQQPAPPSSTPGNSLARSQRPPPTQSSSQTSNQQQLRSSTLSSLQQATTLASGPATSDQSTTDPPTTADPQSVANRYLNSAIDALEAGQPFGTVDYDFDILNDNQTDRRQTANGNGAADPLPVANLTSPSSSRSSDRAQTITRQRLQQQAAAAAVAVAAAASQDQADGQEHRGGAGRARTQSASSPTANNQQQQQSTPPTKKPRPTNKKIVVNHEQALLNNRASTEPARRPDPLFSTPQPLQTATRCDNRACRLPDCKCGDTLNPAGLEAKAIPQIVLLTFDDAVNDLNWEIYEELFSGRTNPNGCPVLATFYVSHEWTDYGQVQTLYSRGHEMASHSVTHSFGEKFSKNQWFKEINGQREILNMYGGVKMNDVRGMRAPFLQIGGNKMFEMLYDANFTYDSSMPIFENSPPLWPYTLDYQLAHECMITPCPTKSFPGVWEVGMTMWVDLRGGRCSMGDACSNPTDEDGVYEMLMKNFNRHYNSNRAPFGLFYHSAWFNTVHHRRGFLRFMSTVNGLPEVFFVTNWQMLQWMRQPTPLSEINSFEPWHCAAKNDRPPPCHHPAVCNVKSEHGTRFMKTCQPCPANQQYPWVGATGFNKSKQSGSG